MEKQSNSHRADPSLLMAWLAARSVGRGLPLPVADRGGLRVDTGLPTEKERYVFASPERGIRELALSIVTPYVFIKLCGTGEQLLELVPPGWQLQPIGYLMTCDDVDATFSTTRPLPAGYRLELIVEQPATVARILAEDGSLAASGYAVEYGGGFVFDRIVTEPEHRRLGLGRAVMAALDSTRRSSTSRRVLVATEEGRALYSTLGWVVHSPFSTVGIAAAGE